jgi:hypothetical protein
MSSALFDHHPLPEPPPELHLVETAHPAVERGWPAWVVESAVVVTVAGLLMALA